MSASESKPILIGLDGSFKWADYYNDIPVPVQSDLKKNFSLFSVEAIKQWIDKDRIDKGR